MRNRPWILPLASVAFLAVANVFASQVAPPRFAELPPPSAPPRLPPVTPEPPQSTQALQVEVTNFPIDERGHLATCDFNSQPKPVQITRVQWLHRLVGYTDAFTLPDVGVFGMTALCQAEFSGSRMCTIGEALGTVAIPDLSRGVNDRAWIRDDSCGRPGSSRPFRDESAGQCTSWSGTAGSGTVIDRRGVVSLQECLVPAGVACCAPVE